MSARGDFSGASILVLDCSTARGSIALSLQGDAATYWRAEFSAGRGHGGELFRSLEEAVEKAKRIHDFERDQGREPRKNAWAPAYAKSTEPGHDADAFLLASRRYLAEIRVGLGPGSYSGVRQAIAAASGLAAATGARLSGFASPLALDTEIENYHAVGDARRGAFYYTVVESNSCVQGPELLSDIDALHARIAERPSWSVLAVESVPPGLPPDTPVVWPSAGCLSLDADAARIFPPLEPIYLRPVSITLPNIPKPAVP